MDACFQYPALLNSQNHSFSHLLMALNLLHEIFSSVFIAKSFSVEMDTLNTPI